MAANKRPSAIVWQSIRVTGDAHATLSRVARLMNKPIGSLFEQVASVWDARWKERMSEDEYARFLSEDISPAEGRRIIGREAHAIRTKAANGNGHDFDLEDADGLEIAGG